MTKPEKYIEDRECLICPHPKREHADGGWGACTTDDCACPEYARISAGGTVDLGALARECGLGKESNDD